MLALARHLVALLAQHQVVFWRAKARHDVDPGRAKSDGRRGKNRRQPRVGLGGLLGVVVAQE